MPLIEDLSRYGIEDCSYSPEAQKTNAYDNEKSTTLVLNIQILIMHYCGHLIWPKPGVANLYGSTCHFSQRNVKYGKHVLSNNFDL
ncbi:hypothetical protein TNCV_4887621 [Trichonephila clavipes]|nr:hypothetical protein TNCV_4887621 [Trichonephila clavipes]